MKLINQTLNQTEVYGGVVYERAVTPETCEAAASSITRLHEALGGVAFYHPHYRFAMEDEGILLTKISKAWIKYIGNPPTTSVLPLVSFLEGNYQDVAKEVRTLEALGNAVDEMTQTVSFDRCVQLYEPTGYMPTHKDTRHTMRLVNVAGKALVNWCSDEAFPQLIDQTDLNPGDILHMNGKIPHGVRAISSDPRIMLGLVDAQAVSLSAVANLS